MQRTPIFALLLVTAVLAVPADAVSRGSNLCESIENHVERLCARRDPDASAQALCMRAAQGALCGPSHAIFASASAEGDALDTLREDFDIVPVEQGPLASFLGPMALGPADLHDPTLIADALDAYDAGQTVAILGATRAEADRFHALISGGRTANCAPAVGSSEMALYALRRSVTRRTPEFASFCLPGPADAADDQVRRWLRERFAPDFAFAAESANEGSDLSELANDYRCGALFTDFEAPMTGVKMQVSAFVNAVRSFRNEEDYYSVDAQLDYTADKFQRPRHFSASSVIRSNVKGASIIRSSPESIGETVSYSKSFNFGVGGSGGFRKYRRLSLRGGLSIAKNEQVQTPPVLISYKPNLAIGRVIWEFDPTGGAPRAGETFQAKTAWVWSVDRDEDASDGDGPLKFEIGMAFEAREGLNTGQRLVDCEVPYPHPRWEIDEPRVDSAEPPAVEAGGGNLAVRGSGFYEDAITAVLVGGIAQAQFQVIDEHEIRIILPGDQPVRQAAPIQVSTEFNDDQFLSNNDVTVQILTPTLPD